MYYDLDDYLDDERLYGDWPDDDGDDDDHTNTFLPFDSDPGPL